MDETDTQRLPQENQRGEAPVRGILEQAETVAQRVLKSIQAVAGTTDCKGVQIITHIIQTTSLTLRPTMSW